MALRYTRTVPKRREQGAPWLETMGKLVRPLHPALALATFPFLVPVLMGQSRPNEVRFHVGSATFFEAEQHVTAGGAYRMYFGNRGWGIEPEFSAMFASGHTDNVTALSVVKDLSRPTARRVWYMLMGGGMNYQTKSRSSLTAWGALAWGIGMKARVGRRWYVAPQVRIGVEPNLRFSLFFGRRMGKAGQ